VYNKPKYVILLVVSRFAVFFVLCEEKKGMDMRGKLSADSQNNSAENVMGMFLIKQRKSPKKTFTKIRAARKELFHEDREKDGRTEGGETDTQKKSQKGQS